MKIYSIESIKASTSIPREFKRVLDKCPSQPLRPIPLTEWAKEVFEVGKRLGVDIEEIGASVRAYAEAGNWSQNHISTVLIDNGIRDQSHDKSIGHRYFKPAQLIISMQSMIKAISGLTEWHILRVDSPRDLVQKSDSTLMEHVARMDKAQLREFSKHKANLTALLDAMDSKIEQKKRVEEIGR